MRRVLFCPPTFFEVRNVKNPYMNPAVVVNRRRAAQQWEALRRAFEEAGTELETIPAVPDLEDMVFAANQTFVGESAKIGKFFVPGHMRYESRRREVPHFAEWLRARGYHIVDLNLQGEFLEGHGDLLWDADGARVWAGYGFRSSRGGVERFAEKMRELEVPVIALQLVDPMFYHLDTCLAPLKPGAALIYAGAFSAEALQAIRQNCARVYEVKREDGLKFACNGVSVNGRFITPHLSPLVDRALQCEGLKPVLVDTSEFEKSGGSVGCLKLTVE
jgi:N-dimethylarginine dimethylaminohydrolase